MTEARVATAGAPARPPTYRAVLGIPAFRRFFASRAVSLAGDAVVPTALTLGLAERGGGAGWLGALLAAALVPKLLFLTLGGVAADRSPKLPLMAASAVVCGAAQLLSALLLVTGGGLGWVLACQAGYGVSAALGHPATFGYLPHCVGPEHLGTANALLSAWIGAAALLGPALTAALAALGSPSLALALDGISFLIAALLLTGLPRGGPTGRVPGGLAALREGWWELRRLPWLLRLTVINSLVLLLVTAPFMVLGPELVLDISPNGWALLMLLFAAGELLGSLVGGRLRRDRPLRDAALCLLGMGLPPLLLATGSGLGPLCVAEVLAGAGIGAHTTLVNTAVHRSATPERLSRVSSLASLGTFAFLPLGYVLAPALAAFLGPAPLLWAAAAWTLASVVTLVSSRELCAFRGPERVHEVAG
ncbi:MFS transporter [Streptomyces sp. PT12]|uniref:MFS transporter n=1 Tax=Streptomyces sp. PT12 TaxID=1510197 RepID=UPI0015EFD943|nr:MFS transporter [Streptomyces sp. PT12]